MSAGEYNTDTPQRTHLQMLHEHPEHGTYTAVEERVKSKGGFMCVPHAPQPLHGTAMSVDPARG